MNIAVTGAGGFLGTHLLRTLVDRGHRVAAVVRPGGEVGPFPGSVNVIAADIMDGNALLAAFAGHDAVIHLASIAGFASSDPSTFFSVNFEGTKQAVGAARSAGVGRFVHVSTRGLLQPSLDGRPVAEDEFAEYRDLADDYLRSKYRADEFVRAAIAEGFPGIIAYPTALVGPGDRKPTPIGRIIKNIVDGKIRFYIDGKLNVVDVRDVADLLATIAESAVPGSRYIIGNTDITIGRLLGLVADASGRRPLARVPFIPALIAAFGLGVLSGLTGREPIVTAAKVLTSRRGNYASIERATREFDYRPRPVDATIRDTVAWFKKNV